MLYRAADAYDHALQKDELLRPSQRDAASDIIENLRAGTQSGYIKRPTGTGKTVIFSQYIKALMDAGFHLDQEGRKKPQFLVLVPSKALCWQVKEELCSDKIGIAEEDVAENLTMSDPHFGRNIKKPVVVMTYNAYRDLKDDIGMRPNDRPFVIMDEVDMAKGDVNSPIFRDLIKKRCTIGFTATDRFKSNGKYETIGDILFDGQAPWHRLSLEKAWKQKDIAEPRNILFYNNIETGITQQQDREFSKAELAQIVNVKGRDAAAIRKMAEFVDPQNGRRLADMNQIWFCANIDHAERVTALLNKVYGKGYAACIHGGSNDHPGMSKAEIKRTLEKHKKGEIPVIVSADMLVRGFDSPKTEVCVMMRPVRSPALAEQAGGRVIRRDPDNPDKVGYVINFIDKDVKARSTVTYGMIMGDQLLAEQKARYAKRLKNVTHKKPVHPFKPDLSMLDGDEMIEVTAHYELDDIATMQGRARIDYDTVPNDQFLSATDMCRELHMASEDAGLMMAAYKTVEEEAQGTNDGPLIKIQKGLNRISITKNQAGRYLSHAGNDHYYIHRDCAQAIQSFLGLRPYATPEWITIKMLTERLGISAIEAEAVMSEIKMFYDYEMSAPKSERLGFIEVEIGNHLIQLPTDKMGYFRKTGTKEEVFCIHESELDTLNACFVTYPKLPDNFLTASGLLHHLADSTSRITTRNEALVKQFMGQLKQAYQTHIDGDSVVPDDHDDTKVTLYGGLDHEVVLSIPDEDMGNFHSPHRRSEFAVDQRHAEDIGHFLKPYHDITNQWRSKSRMQEDIGLGYKSIAQLYDGLQAEYIRMIKAGKMEQSLHASFADQKGQLTQLDIPAQDCGIFLNTPSSAPIFCLKANWRDKIASTMTEYTKPPRDDLIGFLEVERQTGIPEKVLNLYFQTLREHIADASQTDDIHLTVGQTDITIGREDLGIYIPNSGNGRPSLHIDKKYCDSIKAAYDAIEQTPANMFTTVKAKRNLELSPEAVEGIFSQANNHQMNGAKANDSVPIEIDGYTYLLPLGNAGYYKTSGGKMQFYLSEESGRMLLDCFPKITESKGDDHLSLFEVATSTGTPREYATQLWHSIKDQYDELLYHHRLEQIEAMSSGQPLPAFPTRMNISYGNQEHTISLSHTGYKNADGVVGFYLGSDNLSLFGGPHQPDGGSRNGHSIRVGKFNVPAPSDHDPATRINPASGDASRPRS